MPGQSSFISTGGTTYYDLTTDSGDRAEINDALFFQEKPDGSSGTGLIQAIVRVQDPGGGDGEENGYNTSFRPLSYEENTSPNFTTSLLLNSVPIVTNAITGDQYYEFRLDINQLNNLSQLSLDALKVYTSPVSAGQAQGLITGTWFTTNATERYNMDGAGDSSILLDATLSSGSGSSDMFFYVPVSNFGGVDPDITYVTLYSEFGDAGLLSADDGLTPLDDPANTAIDDDGDDTGDVSTAIFGLYFANDGFEEWSVSKQTGGVISGNKWGDTNGNGLWDGTETGLAGWTIDYSISYQSGHGNNKQTVNLTGSVVTSDGTTDVDGDGDIDPIGSYSIFVPASTDKNETYTITLTEHVQAGFVNSYDGDATPNGTTTFTFSGNNLTLGGSPLISGAPGTTDVMNFGNFNTIDIAGAKYTDANGDGLTAGDVGLGGVTILIDLDNSGTLTAGDLTTTTAANTGAWSFTGLGTNVLGHKVLEVLPSGYVQTLGTAGYTISGDATGLNFANFELFDISGTKFTDANGDGLTAGDVGLEGVTIFIDKDNSGTLNVGDLSTTTAADGTWSFDDLGVGYAGLNVLEVLPSGYVQTLGAAGYAITGTSGTDQTGLDFANFELFDISGTKFTDANGDGLTAGDVGLEGVTIFIDKDNSGTLNVGDLSTTTAADGTWSFDDLGVGYAGLNVLEVLPSGYVQTLGAAGYAITGTSGTDQTGLDFANFELFDISGTKFTDANGDGLTAGDVGLEGVTIFIDKDNSGTLNVGDLSTTTAADGTWSFDDLGVGYAGLNVLEVLPSGYVQTLGAAGYAITGTSGTDQTGLDFANFLPDPSIDIEKSVKTNLFDYKPEDPQGGSDDDPDGLQAASSSLVTFKLVVTNDGNETLSGITLSDSVTHTVNGSATTQDIVYTPDGDAGTLDALNVFVDLNGNQTLDVGVEEWSNFDTDGDGTIDQGEIAELAPGETFTLYYNLDSALGQHENTGTVEAVSAISNTNVDDDDDANYYVLPDEDCVGVRTPGFWSNSKWMTFWDAKGEGWGTDPNEPKQAGSPGFASGELLYATDSNDDGFINFKNGDGINDGQPIDAKGLLIGDYNMNGITDVGEDTIFINLADAQKLINASSKQTVDGKTADGIYMLGRDMVATWLNYLANNEDSTGECVGTVANDGVTSVREYLDGAIDWMQALASDDNNNSGDDLSIFQFDARVAPGSANWQSAIGGVPFSGATLHSQLDLYNNTGTIFDGLVGGVPHYTEYCCDAENHAALLAMTQVDSLI